MKSSAEGAALNQKHISGHIRFRGGRAGPGVLPENRIDYGAHPDCEYSLDSEIGVWMQGAAPSALIFMLTIFPGLTAGATLCRRFAPGDVICSVWGEIRTHGSSDVEPRRGYRK
jgi:hypothetical protein